MPVGAGPPQHGVAADCAWVVDARRSGASEVVVCVRVWFAMSVSRERRRSHSSPLHSRRRSQPAADANGWLTPQRAGSHAAAGGRWGYVGRTAARSGVAEMEVRHTAPAVNVDLAASQEHRFELLAGALHT